MLFSVSYFHSFSLFSFNSWESRVVNYARCELKGVWFSKLAREWHLAVSVSFTNSWLLHLFPIPVAANSSWLYFESLSPNVLTNASCVVSVPLTLNLTKGFRIVNCDKYLMPCACFSRLFILVVVFHYKVGSLVLISSLYLPLHDHDVTDLSASHLGIRHPVVLFLLFCILYFVWILFYC